MSHSHTHAPGESCGGHGPQQPSAQQQQVLAAPPQPDPALIAVIEADFKPVSLTLGAPNESKALCKAHQLEKCAACGLDFTALNALAAIFVANPPLQCPPPPQVVQPQRSQAVQKTKEDGNTLFKAQKHQQAISMYTMAASVAAQRLPWEPHTLMREELALVLSNRSAAYAAAGDYIGALVDADAVIQLKRPWNKGHFRKAKALAGLGSWQEAKEAIQLGLSFEPTNTDLTALLVEIETHLKQETRKKS